MERIPQQSILETLAFFDQFDQPLTEAELFHSLWKGEVVQSYTQFLSTLATCAFLSRKDGFLFLKGRESIVTRRAERSHLLDAKMKIAKRAAHILSFLPFVRAVFVCNTVGLGVVHEKSDIDLFIVGGAGRLWAVRLFATFFLHLLRLRRHGVSVTDRVCLSFYASENALQFSTIRAREDDIYLAYWVRHLVPLYDPHGLFSRIQSENRWVHELLPHGTESFDSAESVRVSSGKIGMFFKHVSEFLIGTTFESLAKRVQLFVMTKKSHEKDKGEESHVIISDQMLKFHEDDRRNFFWRRWQENILTHSL